MKPLPTFAHVRFALIVAAMAVVIAGAAFSLAIDPTNDSSGTTSSAGAIPSTTSTLTATTPTSTRASAISNSSTTTETGSTSASVVTTTTADEKRVAEIVLPMDVGDNESLNFQPRRIKVVIGVNNTIVWSDLDAVQHTVKSISVPRGAAPFESGILNQGQSFTVTLTVPGIYRYDCSIHPDWMRGLIQVIA